MHSSFTTVENFIRWWAYLRHPVMLKQWEIEDSIVISRQVSNNAGFGVLHATQLIGHAARLLYFIIRVSSNPGPLDLEKIDCYIHKTANINVKNLTV